MTQLMQAIHENGVFRPLNPVQVAEHEHGSLVIESATPSANADVLTRQRESLTELRATMDALPSNAPVGGLGGADHDLILYGNHATMRELAGD